MAHEYVKISELESTASFGTTDQFVIVQNEETVKIDGTALIESMVTLTNLATRSYVDAVVDSAPGTLDTLRELATALNDDANFGATITNLVNEKLPISNFGLEFWNQLATVNTYHIAEGNNLYWTQERFDQSLAAKNTFHIAEGSNLYFTEQRVLDVVVPLIPTSFVTSYNDLTDKPTIPTDINQLADSSNLLGQGGGSYPTAPTFTTVTTAQLNVRNVAFTGTGAVTIASGNDLNFVAAGDITFNGDTLSAVATSGSYNDLVNKPIIPTDINQLTDTRGMLGGGWGAGGGWDSTPFGITQLKSIVAASTDFADFKARIAAL